MIKPKRNEKKCISHFNAISFEKGYAEKEDFLLEEFLTKRR